MTIKSMLLTSAMSITSIASAAFAQDAPAAPAAVSTTQPQAQSSGDIVVTAQRREQNLEKTPIAISAFTGKMLEERGVVKLENIAASTPGLLITPVTASPNAIEISMRGALELNGGTITSESPVAIYIDDVYQSRLSAANYDLADITRVEVLRGPQGTLYGRNSMTGAIKLITRQPDGSTWLNTDVAFGSYQESKAKISLGTAIAPHIAIAASGFYDNRNDGYIYDEALNKNVGTFKKYGGQVAVGLFDIPNLEATITGRYAASLTDGSYFAPLDIANNKSQLSNFYETDSPREANGDTWQKSISGKLGYDFGAFKLRSITAYEHLTDDWALDFSGGYILPGTSDDVPGFFRTSVGTQHQFTEEVQALGKLFDDKFNWIVGAFYFDEHSQQSFTGDDLAAFGLTYLPTAMQMHSTSLAIYAQGDYKLLDDLTLSVGIRHSHDDKHFDSLTPDAPGADATLVPGHDTAKASVWTPRFNVQYDISPMAMVYATVSKGYRAGGFNSLIIANPALFGTPYKPESVWSYEGGVKLQAFDRKAHLNLDGYYEDLSNLQTLADVGNGSYLYENAAKAKVWGAEAEAGITPFKGFNLYASGAYTDDKYGTLDPNSQAAEAGAKKLPLLSKWQAQLGGSYEYAMPGHGSIVLAGDYMYRSSLYELVTLDPSSRVGANGRTNASLTYKTEGDRVEFYVQASNLFNNKDYYTSSAFVPGVFGYKGVMEPRIVMGGFRFHYK